VTENSWARRTGLAAIGCFFIAAAVIIYWPILNNTFIADDHVFVNAFRATPFSELDKIFTMQSPLFVRPVTMFVFWFHSRLFGLNPWPSHLINVFFHGGSAFLLFCFMKNIGAKKLTAFIAALLFVLTPVAPDAVTWSSGRADVLVLFFILLAMVLYSVYLTKRNWVAFGGAMLASAAALLSKEQGYILIILLPAMDFLFGGIFLQSRLKSQKGIPAKIRLILKDAWTQLTDHGFLFRHGILLLLIFGNVILHFAVIGHMGGYEDVPLFSMPRIGSTRASFRTMLSPLNPSDISWEVIRALRTYIVILCLIGAALVIFRLRKINSKTRRLFIMMVIFFIASLLPIFTPFFTNGLYQSLKNSRWLYSPTVGLLAMMVIALLEFGWQRRPWKILAISALLLLVPVYAVGLNYNNRPWQRAAAINYSIPKQAMELAPDPPFGARLAIMNLLIFKDATISGYGLEESINAAYGRNDLEVIWVKKTDPVPGPDTEGYVFDYDQETGLLRLVKEP